MTNFYTEDYKAVLKVLLGGTDITDSILSYSDIVEGAGQEMFKLGEAPSKEITLELKTDGLDLTLPFDISFEITEDETVKVGRFYLLDFEDTYEKVAILKLYDAMSLFDAPYVSTLDYEAGTTTREQIQEMCDKIGIDVDTSFVRNKIVKWYDSTITMRTYIQWIAELSGCSAIICRDGCLEFKPVWVETPQVENATLNGGYLVDVETQTLKHIENPTIEVFDRFGTSRQINTYEIELRATQDAHDTANLLAGTGTRKIAEMVFDETQDWWLYHKGTKCIIAYNPVTPVGANLVKPYLTSTLKYMNTLWNDEQGVASSDANVFYVSIEKSQLVGYTESSADWEVQNMIKAWLAANPTKVYYELTTESSFSFTPTPINTFGGGTEYVQTQEVEGQLIISGEKEVDMKTLPLDKFWNYTRKEVFNVSRVLFNDGLVEYSIGDETGNTVYLNTKNGYIDRADDLDHLRFLLGFSCSYITDMTGLGDPRIDFGDVCAVYDYVEDTTEYVYINYAGLGYFVGKFSNELKSNVQTKAYEQVADYIGDATIKRIQVQVDANAQSLEVVSQKTEDSLGYIGQLAMDYEEFKTSYSKGYVTEEGMEAYVGTQISQNAEEIRFTFEQALGTTEERLSGDLSEYEDYIAKFIRFVDGQIELGNSASPFQLVISNTGIEIQNNGSPVAYFQNDKMLISKAVIEHSLQIGNVAFIPDANGSMSLRKI